mgnify:CR=1 FL=1
MPPSSAGCQRKKKVDKVIEAIKKDILLDDWPTLVCFTLWLSPAIIAVVLSLG